MTELHEALSRLLDGDLPPDEARALRDRIATEPEVAAAWRVVSGLPEALADLPEEAPPPALDRKVLAAAQPAARRQGSSRWVAVAGWAVAAAAAVVALWPDPQPELILAAGQQWVAGEALLRAGDQVVAIDGTALVTVEPSGGVARGAGAEVEMSVRDAVVGALAGAVVTVAVYEGAARIWPASGDATAAEVVTAGEVRQVGASGPDRQVRLSKAPAGETPEQAVARLSAERDQLAQALEEARFEGALTRGQLAQHQGEPIPWDDTIPAAFRPEAVEKGITAFLADHPELELANLDCDEFPCIATFSPTGAAGGADPMDFAKDLPKAYAGALFGDGAAVMASVAAHEGDDGAETRLVSVAAVPADRRDGDWASRAQYRTEAITADVIDGAMGEREVEVEGH